MWGVVLAIFNLCIICKQEFGCNHNKAIRRIPEVIYVSTSRTSMILNIVMWHEIILAHSVNKLLKLPSWSSFKFYSFLSGSLSPEIPGPLQGEEGGLPWPRGDYLGASWGFSWLKYRQEQAHWEQTAASVIVLHRRICVGIPGAMWAVVGQVLRGGPEGAVCHDGHGRVQPDLRGSGVEPL